jgi:hypothetical protein
VADKDQLKKRLFEMLDACNEQLAKYKELRAKGLSKDDVFEAIFDARKQVLTEILELISAK